MAVRMHGISGPGVVDLEFRIAVKERQVTTTVNCIGHYGVVNLILIWLFRMINDTTELM